MQRHAGLVASVIVLTLASLLQIIFALGMVSVASLQSAHAFPVNPAAPPQPSWMPTVFYGTAIAFLALAAWGIATTVGIHRLRSWGRDSILIIAGLMSVFGLFAVVIMIGMTIMMPNIPIADTARAQTAHAMIRVLFGFAALAYATPLGIGIWWLAYFNCRAVRALFTNAAGEVVESRRPFLLSIYSCLGIFGAASVAVMAFSHIPAVALTVLLHGWPRTIFYLTHAGLQLIAAIGLWRLREWARRLSLALLAFAFVQLGIYLFDPSLMIAVREETRRAMNLPPPAFGPSQRMMQMMIYGLTLLLTVAIAFMLHHYRDRFRPVAEEA